MCTHNEVFLAPIGLWVRPFRQSLTSLAEQRQCGALTGAHAWCARTMPVQASVPRSLDVFLVRNDLPSTSWRGGMRRMLISATKGCNCELQPTQTLRLRTQLDEPGGLRSQYKAWGHPEVLKSADSCPRWCPDGAQISPRSAESNF